MHATEEGRSWKQVLDVPFFVSSAITPGIQLADFMAGALRHHQIFRDAGVRPRDDWERAITRLAELAVAKSHDFMVGTDTYYGLYTMPDRYYSTPPGHRAF